MDVLDLLYKELKEKNLKGEEALRYIYIRVGEIFSFDDMLYQSLFYDDGDIVNERIMEYRPNIRNIDKREIVCKPYSKYVVSKLVSNLLDIDTEVIRVIDHYYVLAFIDSYVYKLDGTPFDLARIKMKLRPLDFKKRSLYDDSHIEDDYFDIDQKIGYIKNTYSSYDNLFKKCDKSKLNYGTIYKKIGKYLEDNSRVNKYYSDATFFIKYMENLALGNEHDNIFPHSYIDDNKNIGKLIKIVNDDRVDYFDLSKESDRYSLREIDSKVYRLKRER